MREIKTLLMFSPAEPRIFSGDFFDMSTAERELLEAVNSNRFEAVRAILKSNPKIDLNKRNCLHWAISFGKVEMTNLLIAAGANVNAFGMAGKETPLIIALTRQHLTIVQILIEAGADVK